MKKKEEIIEKLKQWFVEVNVIHYDEDIGLNCWDKKLETIRDGKTQKEVYIVSFRTEDHVEYNDKGEITSLIEGMYCFAYFDAETLELMYIHKKAGYIEPDGTF